jgi:hypothetical protein
MKYQHSHKKTEATAKLIAAATGEDLSVLERKLWHRSKSNPQSVPSLHTIPLQKPLQLHLLIL